VREGVLYTVREIYLKGIDLDSQRSRVGTTDTRVEAGSNTSTVTLRVVGGDKMGSLKSETVKYGRESQGSRTRE
jgi:hypothetical protein